MRGETNAVPASGGLKEIARGETTVAGGTTSTINLSQPAFCVITDIGTAFKGNDASSGNQSVALSVSGQLLTFKNNGSSSYNATHYYLALG